MSLNTVSHKAFLGLLKGVVHFALPFLSLCCSPYQCRVIICVSAFPARLVNSLRAGMGKNFLNPKALVSGAKKELANVS